MKESGSDHARKGRMLGIILGAAAVGGIIILAGWLRRREREGDWDKEGHGTPTHQKPGVAYRRLEVPPHEPFD